VKKQAFKAKTTPAISSYFGCFHLS